MKLPNLSPLARAAIKYGFLQTFSALQHHVHVLQRLPVQIAIAGLLVLSSHFVTDKDERAWLRDTGGVIGGYAFSKWIAGQGKRRVEPATGKQIRNPTLRIPAHEVERLRKKINGDA